ncbi:uncharacterized protein [Macrobrachium rosenbergii]|uniref:uncharacterized protein n=1 Tax=Macrobrachium rosenbergii TaxID=79674 RepID=UPI0034D4E60B
MSSMFQAARLSVIKGVHDCVYRRLCIQTVKTHSVSREFAWFGSYINLHDLYAFMLYNIAMTSRCSVKMDIKIKLITKNTIRIDKDVRTHPCIITIEGTHNHPAEAASALQELRIPTATTDTFFKYFDLGMTVPQAIRFHQEKLNFNLSDLANAAVNPKSRSVYYMREKWLKNNYGTLGGGDMFSAIKKYADANPLSKIKYEHTGERFTLVLITDFMSTVHREFREAGEVIFVDTTSHFDQLNTAVTPLLCAGPAGALPLGVIFTSSQDEASYTAGFDMLKQMLGDSAFYQQGHPLCFITDNSDAERNALRKVWPNSERYLCIFHILQQVWRWLCDSSHGVKKDHRQLLMQVVKNLLYAKTEQKFNEDWHAVLQTQEAKNYENFVRFITYEVLTRWAVFVYFTMFFRYVTNLIQRKEEWCILYRAGRLLRGNQTNNYAEATMCIIKDIILNRCKAFNTSQLLMFMNEVFDLYMKQRLLM